MLYRTAHRLTALLILVVLTTGCTDIDRHLRLAKPTLPVDQKIANEFAALLNEQSTVSVTIVDRESSEQSVIEALIADRADIALISNNRSFTPEVATIMPMYANVLHILIRMQTEAADVAELFSTGRVFAGPPDSPSRIMLREFAVDQGIDPTNINFVNESDDCPDIVAIFAPIVRDTSKTIGRCNYRMQDLLRPGTDGEPSAIGAAILFRPSLRTFEIPARTYGSKVTPEPLVTLAVDKMLVARHDVPLPLVYDLIGEISRLRPALAAIEPSLFFGLDDNFDSSDSTYVLHPGALSYINRDEPSIYERYSGIAEVAVTAFVALLSGSIAAVRIYNIRRKNRIDVFYSNAIAVRQSVNGSTGADQRREAIMEIRRLQTTAFELLVAEKLAADESFRIFITLSNDIIRELKDPNAPDWTLSGSPTGAAS